LYKSSTIWPNYGILDFLTFNHIKVKVESLTVIFIKQNFIYNYRNKNVRKSVWFFGGRPQLNFKLKRTIKMLDIIFKRKVRKRILLRT